MTSNLRKINVITLGCSKNLVDSEVLMRQIEALGIEVVHDASDTDAGTVIINTCGFIQDAKQESIDTILEYVRAKEEGRLEKLFVMGCLSERY
jgi:ribosomal protein S12 methylthiotransferase